MEKQEQGINTSKKNIFNENDTSKPFSNTS